jgi:hypothetical protein
MQLNEDGTDELSQATMTLSEKLASELPTADYQYVDRGNGERALVLYFSGLLQANAARNL